jgi:hypothetical protein
MGLLTDEDGRVRWRMGGVLFALVLALALLPPMLRTKEISHPRSGEQRIDLCGMLPEPPAPIAGAIRKPGTGGSMCEFQSAGKATELTVGAITTREMSVGRPARMGTMYETWLKEAVADGAKEVREQPGDWAKANSYRNARTNHILVEDHGVMLMLSSNRLESDALVQYARAVATDLRKPKK